MPYHIYPLGDQALTVDWGNRIDESLNDQVLALYEQLRGAELPGILDLIPAYSSLTLVFDPVECWKREPALSPYIFFRQKITGLLNAGFLRQPVSGRCIEIPVCYDPVLSPDLETLANQHRLRVDQVIDLHTGREYRVYMLGFLPGFAYLGRVDEQIATPRLAYPRTRVRAGSLGIAGEQTGIYPSESPGGWNIIGCTPLKMFDAYRAEPALLRPGDQVRFYPISLEVFHQMVAAS